MSFVQVVCAVGMVMAQIKVNGNYEEIIENATIEVILENRSLPLVFVVELNKNIIKKENYGSTFLKNGDEVEIVTFCAGG